MGRIEKAYRTRFRWLLKTVNARQIQRGVDLLIARAEKLQREQGLAASDALFKLHEELSGRLGSKHLHLPLSPLRFFCDAGLGGLARWLRAAGYEAAWEAGIDDPVLLQKAAETNAAILTTDSMLMERRVIRDRLITAYWLPPTLSITQELRLVFMEFHLQLRTRRCMACGGELRPADKENLRERIPPRTYLWRDEYFLCSSCGHLYWHGTHWERIHKELQHVAQSVSGAS